MNVRAEPPAPSARAEVNILGLSCFYHDSAACLVREGRIVAAAQEERFTREKHDAGFPKHAIAYCLREGGVSLADVDYVAFYEKPFLKFDRLLHSYLAYAPAGLPSFLKAIPLWIKEKIWMKDLLREQLGGYAGKILFPEHHEAHAASAFFPSPFREAAILTVDGVGEWTTTSFGVGRDHRVELHGELHFPHSLGLLYSAFTYYTGFKVNSGEYKLMGLAPYGEPTYKDVILSELIDLKEDGSFKLNMRYFNYGVGLTMINERFERLFGGPPRPPEGRLTQRDMDVARSIQAVTEEVMCRMARHVRKQTGMKRLVLAGGVALNCVANGCILREGIFEDLWIQPAAGDAGGAIGAALVAWHHYLDRPRRVDGVHDAQQASLLGPRFDKADIRHFLTSRRIHFEELNEEELTDRVADLLAQEKIIGWFCGRMEFGPRALGARSIIGDARSRRMQAAMNLKIKFRESFRPFAPCVLREHVHEWFGMRPNEDSPYMLLVAPVLEKHRAPQSLAEQKRLRKEGDLVRWVNVPRSSVPAITHVDFSARVQTVDERHGRYRRVMEKFHARTGCPVIVNTSFNLSWEPIVCTPEEAYATFMQSDLDALVLEDFLLLKDEQPVGFRPWLDGEPAPPSSDSPWADPHSGEPLLVTPTGALNAVTGAKYPVTGGIPLLFVPTEDAPSAAAAAGADSGRSRPSAPVSESEEAGTLRSLLESMRRDAFARLLNEQVPYDARVLEIGCGAGHLTNFLSVAHRSVLGTDVSVTLLRQAQTFKETHGLDGAVFAQMNPRRPALREGFFDFVIVNHFLAGVAEPGQTLGRLARLAKPGGFILLRLERASGLGVLLGRRGSSLEEALRWLDESGLEFVNALPKPAGGAPPSPRETLFEPATRGTRLSRWWSQLRSSPRNDGDGGALVVIGRRR